MYESLNSELLILPDWLDQALKAHYKEPSYAFTLDGLKSILSANDLEYYFTQCEQLKNHLLNSPAGDNPLGALIESLQLLHTKPTDPGLEGMGSGLTPYVKNNTSYGNKHSTHDLVCGYDMRSFIPRDMAARVDEGVIVNPIFYKVGSEKYVLSFQLTGVIHPLTHQEFLQSTITELLTESGFDQVSKTKLFDLSMLCA